MVGAEHTKFKFVAGEGKGRCAVAVGGVGDEIGDGANAQIHDFLFGFGDGFAGFDGFKRRGQLIAQKDGDDGRRGFAAAETVIVAGAGDGAAQELGIAVNRFDDGGQKGQKLQIGRGILTGIQEVFAGVGGDGPVVVLAGAVDALKGLFVEQTVQVVLGGLTAQGVHDHMVGIRRLIADGEHRRQLVLAGGDFVVAGFGGDAHAPQFPVDVAHKGADAAADAPEIVIVHFLAFGGLGPEKGAVTEDQVLAFFEHFVVDQKIFLFGADGAVDAFDGGVAE